MIYVIVAIIVAIISGRQFSKHSTSLSIYKLNMMSWSYYIAFIAYSLIGAVLVINQWDDDFVNHNLGKASSAVIGFWAVVWTILVFPLGMRLSNKLFKKKNVPNYYENYLKRTLEDERYESGMLPTLLLFSLLDIVMVAYVFYCYGTIPIIELLQNPSIDTHMVRYETSREFDGSYSIKMLATILTPLLSYVYVIYAIKKRNSLFLKVWAGVMFVLAISMAGSTFAKSPVFLYVISFLFVIVYVKGKVSKTLLLIGGGLGVLILFVSYLLLASETSAFLTKGELAQLIGQRIFVVQIESTFLHFDNFPDYVPFIGFKSLFSPGMSDMLGLPHVDVSAKQMMDMFNSDLFSGVRNSLFISEAYANFGWLGVIISPLYVGFIVQTIFTFLLYSRKTPYMVSLLVYFSINNHLTQGINYYIFSEEIIWIIFLSIAIYTCSAFLSLSPAKSFSAR